MQVQTTSEEVDTTDILARKEGMFEQHELVGAKPTTMDALMKADSGSELESVDIPSEAVIVLLEFESVDGERVTARPMSRFILYNNQGSSLREIIANRSGFVVDGKSEAVIGGTGWNVAVAPNREDASYLTDNKSELTYSIFSPQKTIQSIQIKLGLRSTPDWDKISSRAVTGLSKAFYDIGTENMEQFVEFAENFPREPFKTRVVEMTNHSRMTVQIGTDTFDLVFEGRPSESDHVPTQLADELGVGTPENIEGEDIVIGAGQYAFKKTEMKVVGRNKSGSVAVGI